MRLKTLTILSQRLLTRRVVCKHLPLRIFLITLSVFWTWKKGYHEFIKQLYEQNIQKYEKSEKHRIDVLLRQEVDKLNRWLIDEKQAISLKAEKMKNKIISLKRDFKMEKNFEAKLAIEDELQRLQKEMNDSEFNTFDIERELEKKCNRLIAGKKRSLKMDYAIDPVFDVTWSVE
jgi:succinate dehydrogenase flavin-adding protein (antitoxin of CptAB toxin-antitoxin module)